jgi:phosphatidate cytidylyltransferase
MWVGSAALAKSKSKNLVARILVSLLLVPLTLAAMAAPLWVTAIYALLWILAASVEFLRLYLKPFRAYHLVFLIGPVLIWSCALPWTPFSLATWLFTALVIQGLLWVFVFSSKPRLLLPLLILPLYLGFIPAHFVLLKAQAVQQNLSYAWLICPLGVIWINDSAAYLLGTFLGRTPLCPDLSPRKTVEGFFAGIVLSAGFGVGFAALFLRDQPLWWSAVLALAVALAAVLGDLVESAIKRERGVKHSSRILGGHGGVLDGIDGLIFGLAAYYYITLILGKL